MKFGKQFWTKELGAEWTMQLKETLRSPYIERLMGFLQTEYALNMVYPAKEDVFKAFKLCPWDKLKIVIMGQEPHLNGEANGLSYGDKNTVTFHTAVLGKIYDCIDREYHPDALYLDFDFTLEDWAKQGVFLLNTSLTTRAEKLNSHKKPWKKFISAVLNAINNYKPGTIFILWGKEAQLLIPYINKNNYILTYDHPVEYVSNFKDWHCPNFKEADKILIDLYGETINW